MKVEIYSDVACPWCYIGKARFERAVAALPGGSEVEVVYRPYQLDPRAPAEGVPMMEYLEGRFGTAARSMAARVEQSAREEGLTMDYGRGVAANTLDAHRLMALAERVGGAAVQQEVAEGLFRAHFSEGLDIADRAVLESIGTAAGLEAEAVQRELASDDALRAVQAEIAIAQRLGITAVPTFVFDGRYAVQGAQPTSTFVQVLEQVRAETSGEGEAESCADGACVV